MKRNRITTTSIREIKTSFKRFLSLLVMSLLGVGVFVGISATAPDMIKSIDSYYDENNHYDIKIISTLGITDDDINELNELPLIDKAYATHSKDTLVTAGDKESVVKVISVNDEVNKISLEKGRLPKSNDEIVIERAMLERNNLKLNDVITLLDNETFKDTKLKVVGVVKSSLYISNPNSTANRGNTNIGTGKIDYYAYVNGDNFKLDYFTESYITVKGAKKEVTNSKSYNKLINDAIKSIEKIKNIQQKKRYDEIYTQINNEIKANEEQGRNKLKEAKGIIDNASLQLKNGKNTLDKSKKLLREMAVFLDGAKLKIDDAQGQLEDARTKLTDANNQIIDGKNKINEELSNYGLTLEEVNNIISNVENVELNKEDIIKLVPEDALYRDEILILIDKMYEVGLENIFNEVANNPDKIDELIAKLPLDFPYYNEIIELGKALKEVFPKIKELKSAIIYINDKEKEYNDGLTLYNESLVEYNKNKLMYDEAFGKYQVGLQEYNQGVSAYNSNLNLYNSKVSEYHEARKMLENKISEAKSQLSKIPDCKWYVYNRLDDGEYANFINDGNSISNLSKVFPSIFFIVAVLISLISMSRMVEDDRVQIGTLKSLGFSNKHIRVKYLLYAGIATILGGLIGAMLGFFLLPAFIWNIYKIIFDLPKFVIDYDFTYVIIGILIAVICICGTTLLTIMKVVKEKPSDLMRPKAPSGGKRVFLERVRFVWNHLKFSNKVTIRNLFRYKKRVLMTVVGIAGCTGLMLAGFGLRDSIVDIPSTQYGKIFNFDDMVYVTGNVSDENVDKTFDVKHVKNFVKTMMVTGTSKRYAINLFVPNDTKELETILDLRELDAGKKLSLEDDKIVISDKLSQLTNKVKGDKLTITDSEGNKYEFMISGVSENYVGHYVFMNKKTYVNKIGKYDTNVVFMKLDDLKHEEKISSRLLENDNVMSVISVNGTIKTIDDMLKSLDSVVFILIILSASLSFVVLYNLSYINISERKREIATLKVLGFTDKEVDAYITKETIALTFIGIVIGLILGVLLTNVIINTVEIEMVRFIHHINFISYVYSSVMTIIFTVIVNVITHYTLKKIDMIESLKSVE